MKTYLNLIGRGHRKGVVSRMSPNPLVCLTIKLDLLESREELGHHRFFIHKEWSMPSKISSHHSLIATPNVTYSTFRNLENREKSLKPCSKRNRTRPRVSQKEVERPNPTFLTNPDLNQLGGSSFLESIRDTSLHHVEKLRLYKDLPPHQEETIEAP